MACMCVRRGEEQGAHEMMVAEVLMVAATTLRPADMQRCMLKPLQADGDDDDDDDDGDGDTRGSHIASRAWATISATASRAWQVVCLHRYNASHSMKNRSSKPAAPCWLRQRKQPSTSPNTGSRWPCEV